MSSLLSRLAVAGLLATIAQPALGQTFWAPSTGGNWFTAANWDSGVPNATSAYAQFGRTGTGSQTVNVDGAATVGRLVFGSFNTSLSSGFAHTLSGGSITLDNFAGAAQITRQSNAAAATMQTPLIIAAGNTLTVVSGNTSSALTLASLAGTSATVTFNPDPLNNSGLVVLQSGSYGGVTNLQGGILRAVDGGGLPADTSLRIAGGTGTGPVTAYWELPGSGTVTRSIGSGAGQLRLIGSVGFSGNNGPVTLDFGNGAPVVWGSAAFDPTRIAFGHRFYNPLVAETYTWQNPIDLNGATRTVSVPGGNVALLRATATLTGVISNSAGTAGGLTLTSTVDGVVALTGANTYNGPTTVGAGVIFRATDGVGLPAASNLVVQGGTVESAGATSLDRPLGGGAGQVRLPGGTAGFAAVGGPYAVQIGGAALPQLVWGTTDFNPGALRLGSVNADALTDFRNPIDLNVSTTNTVRFLEGRNNTVSTSDVSRVSGVISNSGATGTGLAVSFTGTGVIELTAANTYNVQTVVTSSQTGAGLRLVGSGSFANSPVVTVDTGEVLDVSQVTGGANFSAAANRFLLAPGQTLAGTGTVTGGVLVGPGAVVRGGSTPATFNLPTGQLTVAGPLRLVGSSFGPSAALLVDLNGATASGATVSRVAVTGGALDLAATAGPLGSPVVVRLTNDAGLTAGQSYTFTVASADGGFARDGSPVTGFTFGTDFVLESATFAGFSSVSLTASGTNLVLVLVPVPEPAAGLAVAAVGLLARRRMRRAV